VTLKFSNRKPISALNAADSPPPKRLVFCSRKVPNSEDALS
jgi:hypothetical protein